MQGSVGMIYSYRQMPCQHLPMQAVTMFMYWDFACFTVTTHFVANYVEFCKKRNFMGSSRFITVLADPQIILRNI